MNTPHDYLAEDFYMESEHQIEVKEQIAKINSEESIQPSERGLKKGFHRFHRFHWKNIRAKKNRYAKDARRQLQLA